MMRPSALGIALVLLAACGGRFAGEAPEDAGSVDSEPVVSDASRAPDAGETRDGIAPEAAPDDANTQDGQVPLCPSGEATCPDIDLCVEQIAASPPQGVVATDQANGTDSVRLLAANDSGLTPSQITSGGCEFLGSDGHRYAFISVDDGKLWVIVDGDVAPAVYALAVQYIQCGCFQGKCEPQDAGAGD